MAEVNDAAAKLSELEDRRAKIRQHGGAERVEAQHAKGKLTARERIAVLVDEGSFVEYDEFRKTRSVYYGLDKQDLPADGVVGKVVVPPQL